MRVWERFVGKEGLTWRRRRTSKERERGRGVPDGEKFWLEEEQRRRETVKLPRPVH